MKRTHGIAVGLMGAISLGMAVATAHAHSGPMGGEMRHGATGGPGAMGMHGGRGHGAGDAARAGTAAAQGLMTAEERAALITRMRAAATPEERQQIAAANHAEMQKRAAEKGVTLPEHGGPRAGFGRHAAPATGTPAR